MLTALDALERLRRGNARFVADGRASDAVTDAARRRELVERQEPFAVILGCSDSRVPAELVFDHGLGELFVIRVAGNVVAPPVMGSVEFAAGRLGTRLVVVLGHTGCGAVAATLEQIERPVERLSPGLRSIVDRVRPAIEPLLAAHRGADDAGRDGAGEALARRAVRANIRASAERLRTGSELLGRLIETDGLRVVGAEYSLETGAVEFFDGVPEGS